MNIGYEQLFINKKPVKIAILTGRVFRMGIKSTNVFL